VFRDEFKNPNLSPGTGLRFELRDFAPQQLAQGVAGSFLIDSATLCRFLNEAELDMRTNGVEDQFPPGTFLLRREHTPPDELNSRDEEKFRNAEQMAKMRLLEGDASYTSSQLDMQEKEEQNDL